MMSLTTAGDFVTMLLITGHKKMVILAKENFSQTLTNQVSSLKVNQQLKPPASFSLKSTKNSKLVKNQTISENGSQLRMRRPKQEAEVVQRELCLLSNTNLLLSRVLLIFVYRLLKESSMNSGPWLSKIISRVNKHSIFSYQTL